MTEGLGLASWRLPKLYSQYSFEKIWHLPESELQEWGFKVKDLETLRAYRQANRLSTNVEQLSDRKIWCVPLWDSLYPKGLKETVTPPLLLFGKGDKTLLSAGGITMVGTRQFEATKDTLIYDLCCKLSKTSRPIISGLARGVDAFCHKAALHFGVRTVAVVAHGLDYIYPPEHDVLRDQIVATGGCVVSELPLGIGPEKYLFLARNRIMVGLGRILVVVQAGLKSGSLASATLAAEAGREVWAIPGSPGTDLLIQEGANRLTLDNIEDLGEDEGVVK